MSGKESNSDHFSKVKATSNDDSSTRTKAIIFMQINLVFQICNRMNAKYAMAEFDVHSLDVCFYRTFILLVVIFCVAKCLGHQVFADVPQDAWKIVMWRGLLGTLAYYAMVSSIANLPLMVSAIIINTAPFWTIIFAFYVNKERMT